MAGHEKFHRDIGISFEWRVNKESKKLEYRDLTGPEKILVMQKKFQSLLPNFKETKGMELLRASFIGIRDLKIPRFRCTGMAPCLTIFGKDIISLPGNLAVYLGVSGTLPVFTCGKHKLPCEDQNE